MNNNDIKFIELAIKESLKAYKRNEVPIGAVLVKDDAVIAKAYNKKEKLNDATKHAEILVINKASKKLNSWRLLGTTLYVTLEPCAMCASAIKQARIKEVVFALDDPINGAIINGPKLYNLKSINKNPIYRYGILKDKYKEILQNFFKNKRTLKKNLNSFKTISPNIKTNQN